MSNRGWLVFAGALVALWWLLSGGDDTVKAPSMKPTSTDTASVSHAVRPATLAEVLGGVHTRIDDSLQFTRARLEGVVLDEKDVPIANATVRLGSETTTADEAGAFAFEDIATGDVKIIAELGDMYGEESTSFSEDDELIEVHMKRGPTLTVTVVSAKTNQPIAGASLDVDGRDGITDDKGVATFRGIDSAGERIRVSADGYASVRVDAPIDEEHPLAPVAMTVKLEGGAALRGVVLDPSGALLPDAQVRVETMGGQRVDIEYTDEHGAFVIPAVAAGGLSIKASSKSFIEAPPLLLQHDGIHDLTGIEVHVVPGAEIAGRVVDQNGKPVADATIDGLSCDNTDADGRFIARGLDPGDKTVSAHDATRGSVAQKITVAIGQRAELNFVLSATSIAGKVVDKHGNGIADATVYAHLTTDEYTTAMASTDEYGVFDLGGIAPGTWLLRAQRPEEASRPMPDKGGITVPAGTHGVKLELPELATLAARVTLDGQPVAFYGVRIVTHVEDPDANDWGGRTDNVNDANGAFERSDLTPGDYDVTIAGPDFKKKRIAHVTLREGARTDLGTLAMSRGRIVHGRVVDERHVPIAGALVAIGQVPNHLSEGRIDQRMANDATTHTDAAGAFVISGLDEGAEVKIVATHETAGISVMRDLAQSEDNIELVIVETGDIVGEIENYTERTGSGASVVDANNNLFDGEIDPTGHFVVHGVPPGEAEVRIYGENSMPAQKITVVGGQTVSMHFAMPKDPIEVDLVITMTGECAWVTLDGDGVHAGEGCDAGVVHMHAVPAGTYKVCEYPACGTITVAPSPQKQTIPLTLTADQPVDDWSPPPDDGSADDMIDI